MSNADDWPVTRAARDLQEVWNQLSELQERMDAPGEEGRFRGHADVKWSVLPSFERSFANVISTSDRDRCLKAEQDHIKRFIDAAAGYIGWTEAAFISDAPMAALTLARHYGLATRLVDWSKSAFVAAYFAIVNAERHNVDGVVWWYSGKALHANYPGLWRSLFDKESHVEPELFQCLFGDSEPPAVLAEQHLAIPFPRIAVQQGLFTIHSRFGTNHAEAIASMISDKQDLGRVIIPSALKTPLLRRLQRMNFCAESVHTAEPHLIADKLNAAAET